MSEVKGEQITTDGCSIVLHRTNDGHYHWLCRNCKRENVSPVDAIDLSKFLPIVVCRECGFEFGVDKSALSITAERDLIEEVSMATPKTSDTIILHPNNDGTYHWMCPNCKREDLGLSAETDLENYLPNITCPNCGFQFGVDKRYLSTSYICGECLVVQRFDGACGNCGARAMRRASTPVPLASSPQGDAAMPEPTTPQLSESDVEAIEARANAATEGPWTAYHRISPRGAYKQWHVGNKDGLCQITMSGHERDYQFMAYARTDIPALIRDWRALKARNSELESSVTFWQAEALLNHFCSEHAKNTRQIGHYCTICARPFVMSMPQGERPPKYKDLIAENAALREQLAEAENERDAALETLHGWTEAQAIANRKRTT